MGNELIRELQKAAGQQWRQHLNRIHLIGIQSRFDAKREISSPEKRLLCPKCRGGDVGIRLNGKPWCWRCNGPLVRKGTVKRRVGIKILGKAESLRKESHKLNPGLTPKSDEKW